MGNGIQQVRAYLAERIRCVRAMLVPAAAQLRSLDLDRASQHRFVLERLARTLTMHLNEMSEHLVRLGGAAPPEDEAPPLAQSAVSSAKLLREVHAELCLAHDGALMLETNARALGYASTAALARRHREELTTLMARVRELLPASVKGEIQEESLF